MHCRKENKSFVFSSKLFFIFFLLLLTPKALLAHESFFNQGLTDYALYSEFGPSQLSQTGAWISCDALVSSTDKENKSIGVYEISTGFFNYIDGVSIAMPVFLTPQHYKYFVSISNEAPTTFSVLYQDSSFGTMPISGYPKVSYWPANSPDVTTITLDQISQIGSSYLYRKQVSIPNGVYNYQYIVRNVSFPYDFALEIGSFSVCLRPTDFVNSGISDNKITSTGKIDLEWLSTDPAGTELTYRLYAGVDPANLELYYEGKYPRYELTSLQSSKLYYWQVETINAYGASSRSPLYTFSTIGSPKKAFNYPNPFNPAINQTTNIVFDLPDVGSAELYVYTELGDLCWHKSFSNLFKGSNEITYDGKDDNGRVLYNGPYVCMIKKKCVSAESLDKCRLLVIK
jgi:hypothetical protein